MESRPIIEVRSLGDERLADYRDLTDHPLRTRFEDEHALMIVESKMALEVALDEGLTCSSLLIDERRLASCAHLIERVDPAVPVYVMDHDAMSELVGFKVTRGVLAAFHRLPALTVDEAIDGARNVCVVEDVKIGNNVTIGAGSVVTKDIPDDATAAGNYAKVLNYKDPGRYILNRWKAQEK